MSIRKRAIERLHRFLENKAVNARWELQKNKEKIKDLVQEQKILKKEVNEIHGLLRLLKKRSKETK